MDYIKIYNHVLGRDHKLEHQGKNAKGYCPFCEKNGLSIDVATGKGSCFACSESVNVTSFITKYHKAWLEYTPDEYYLELEEARGISASVFKHAQFAYDGNNDKWLVPYKNPHTDFLSNLGSFRIEGDFAYKIFVLPNEGGLFPKGFYNPWTYTAKPRFKGQQLYIPEGEWDTLAWYDMAIQGHADKARLPAILGSPGANIVPKDIDTLTKEYRNFVGVGYDNDKAGQEGLIKIATHLAGNRCHTQYLNWKLAEENYGKSLEGYDIRDLLTKARVQFSFVKKAFEAIEIEAPEKTTELGPGFIDDVEPIEPVPSHAKYMELYGKQMFLTQTNKDAITLTMAIAASSVLPGQALWAFIVGNASSGKTTLIESYGGEHQWSNYASKLTSKSLISGMQGKGMSLIEFINHKPFFLKDFTVVLEMGKDEQKELFGLLRDIYDGSVKIVYGNGKVEIYRNIHFPIIAGVTQAIYKVKNAELGERFLRINYSDENPDDDVMKSVLSAAIKGFGRSSAKKDDLTKATIGYLKTVKENFWDSTDLPVMSDDCVEILGDLAIYVSFLRANPEHHRTEGLLYRPKPEDPPRLSLQFTTLGYSLTKVLEPLKTHGDILHLTDEATRLIYKAAVDTCYGFGQDVVKYLHANPKSCHSDIVRYAHIEATRCYRVLTELKSVGIIHTITKTGGKGRSTILYRLSDKIQTLTDKIFPSRTDG